jgi:hypothetical protein
MLLLGWLAAARYLLIADWIVAAGFIGLSLVTWLTLGHAQLTTNQAELRTALGTIAWGLFGIAWVRPRRAPNTQQGSQLTASLPRKSLGGLAHIGLSLVLVGAVFLRLGIPRADGRGVLVTAIALGWSLWLLLTSGVLAERLERESRGPGFGLLREPAIFLAIALTAAGLIMGKLIKLS